MILTVTWKPIVKMNKTYWEQRYADKLTGWDLGYPAPAIQKYIEGLHDKNLKILIPGSGNAYEAEYLFSNGFLNVYVLDIAEAPLLNFKKRVPEFPDNQLLKDDFFNLTDTFDLILEHTFFCALEPNLRKNYALKMHRLLEKNGTLAGLLFNFPLTAEGPPYGGTKEEYREIFGNIFHIEKMETAYNSIKPRRNRELFFTMKPIN